MACGAPTVEALGDGTGSTSGATAASSTATLTTSMPGSTGTPDSDSTGGDVDTSTGEPRRGSTGPGTSTAVESGSGTVAATDDTGADSTGTPGSSDSGSSDEGDSTDSGAISSDDGTGTTDSDTTGDSDSGTTNETARSSSSGGATDSGTTGGLETGDGETGTSTGIGSTGGTGSSSSGADGCGALTMGTTGDSGGAEGPVGGTGDPCGNGDLDPGEDCDDGNLVGGDGCEADCTSSDDVGPIWTFELGGPNGYPDCGTGAAFDADNNMILAAHTAPESEMGLDVMWIRKYDPDYNELWTVTYPAHASGCGQVRVAVDEEGNIAFIGEQEVDDPYTDLLFGMLDPDGNELWTEMVGGTELNAEISGSAAFDPLGNPVFTGGLFNALTSGDLWVSKYTADGMLLWSDLYDGVISEADTGRGIATDCHGNVLVVGNTRGLADNHDIFVRKYAPDGDELWTDIVEGAADATDFGRAIAVTADGDVVGAGIIRNRPGNGDAWLRRYTPGGAEVWTATYTGTGTGSDGIGDIAVDANETLLVAGSVVDGPTDSRRYWLARVDADGSLIWERRRVEPGGWNAVGVAPDGRIAVAGDTIFGFPFDNEARFAVYPP